MDQHGIFWELEKKKHNNNRTMIFFILLPVEETAVTSIVGNKM